MIYQQTLLNLRMVVKAKVRAKTKKQLKIKEKMIKIL